MSIIIETRQIQELVRYLSPDSVPVLTNAWLRTSSFPFKRNDEEACMMIYQRLAVGLVLDTFYNITFVGHLGKSEMSFNTFTNLHRRTLAYVHIQ